MGMLGGVAISLSLLKFLSSFRGVCSTGGLPIFVRAGCGYGGANSSQISGCCSDFSGCSTISRCSVVVGCSALEVLGSQVCLCGGSSVGALGSCVGLWEDST